MELNDFMSALTESLKKRGIPDDVIRAHMTRLLPSLSEEDLAEIAAFRSAEDFTDISDCTAAALAQTVKVEIPESGNGTPHASEKPDHSAERSKTGHSVKKEKMPEIPITEEGKKRFILISALTSPLWAIAAVLYALLWIAAFAVEALSVAAAVCASIGVFAAGCAASVSGIIYGIFIMMSEKAIGIYEIGFGIIVAGASLLGGVLLYNFAIRFMPFAIKKTAEFFMFCLGRVRVLLHEFKRRCFEV